MKASASNAMRLHVLGSTATLFLFASSILADGPADNDPAGVRQIPPRGIEVPADVAASLQTRRERLAMAIEALARRGDPALSARLPDVEIFERAVRVAFLQGEFFSRREIDRAGELLDAGAARAEALERGEAPWLSATGLVVRGYRSRLDDTVQPYGLVIPSSYSPSGARRHRLDIWFHGRGETQCELGFIAERMRQVGQYAPPDAIVLHPFGRYSNAFRFAGEIDVLEALAEVQRHYRIDPDRISVRGFSMGGAACWQFAVHYPGRWFAANPGAGFSETQEFLRGFQRETLDPRPWERTLWHLYDATDCALNLSQCPTIAYSGEIDAQKQAADMMEAALARAGIPMVHIIGPKTAHRIHEDSKVEIERRMASLAERGRVRVPRSVRFVTYTLRYNQSNWVTLDALEEHWKEARVDAALEPDDSGVSVKTANVAALTLAMEPGWCPFPAGRRPRVVIDGEALEAAAPASDRSWECRLQRVDGAWRPGAPAADAPRKRHGLQGPVDDAFLSRFLFVEPGSAGAHEAVDAWARSELRRAINEWRRHFRGDVRIKKDADVTGDDVAESNLILFGDPASNAVLARVAARLPIRWTPEAIEVGAARHDAARHALILIAPNPENPQRYVVLNSGFTYREYAYLNNARQAPMIPDWAVVDVSSPPTTRWPGRIIAADFFGEDWKLRAR